MARAKARTREESEQMKKKEAQRKALLEATASANKKKLLRPWMSQELLLPNLQNVLRQFKPSDVHKSDHVP